MVVELPNPRLSRAYLKWGFRMCCFRTRKIIKSFTFNHQIGNYRIEEKVIVARLPSHRHQDDDHSETLTCSHQVGPAVVLHEINT